MDISFTYKTLDDKAYYCLSIFYARSGWPALLAQVLAFHAQPLPPIGNGSRKRPPTIVGWPLQRKGWPPAPATPSAP